MPNQAVIDLIARTLPHGLPHPGDGANTPPRLVPLPGFRATGMSDEQADEMIGKSAQVIAEALTNLIETDYEILTKADIAQLRQDAADAPDGTRILRAHRGNITGPIICELVIDKTDDIALPEAILREVS